LNDPPNIQRAGGWGPLLGEGGSGYGVAMEYLRRCVRKLDPRPCGDLGDEAALRNEKPAIAALMNELQVKDLPDLKRLANDATQRSKIAGAARLILDFAGQGDVLADRVMRIHAAELANQAFQIWESIGSPKRDWDLVLAGGLLVGSEAFRGCFLADLTERASSPRETLIVEAPSVVALQLATLQWSP
jgi:N-acetylglucosamine kinase-like BadF-type ATPase